MLALESGQRPCCSPAGQSLRSTVPQTLSQPDEPQGWLDMLAFSHLPTPTCPFRLTGCDHFFIAVPQPALPAHSMNCVCTYQFAELIRLAYFKSGPYSKVVLSWMQSHSTWSRINLTPGCGGSLMEGGHCWYAMDLLGLDKCTPLSYFQSHFRGWWSHSSYGSRRVHALVSHPDREYPHYLRQGRMLTGSSSNTFIKVQIHL